jgi:hypothetical protein
MLPKATIFSDHNGIEDTSHDDWTTVDNKAKKEGQKLYASSASSISINDGCMLQDVPINVGLTMFQMRLNHMAYKPISIK